jgi:hypothetical protein
MAIVKVANASDLRKALAATQYGQIAADPALKPLKDDVSAKLADFNKDLKQRIGVTLEELLETPQGPAWLAITRQEGEVPFGVLMAADAGANSSRMKEILTKGTEQLKEQKGQVTTESFKDLELNIIQPPAEGEGTPLPLIWTSEGSTYFIGLGLDPMKDLLANAEGREDSLAANESFATILAKAEKDSQVQWFVDLGQVVKLGMQQAAEQGGDPGQAEAMLGLLGVNQIKAAGGGIRFGSGAFDTESTTFVSVPGERVGLLKLFEMPAVSMAPEPWVPATISTYWTLSWDLDAAYVGLTDLVNQFLPGAIENVERGLQGPGGETIRFQQDLFGPLGDRITVISDLKEAGKAETARTLVAVALEDTKGFQATLNKILAITGAAPKKRDFQGVSIYDFEVPEMPAQAGAPPVNFDGPISMTVAKDCLFFTTDTTLLEQVLRPGSSALADSPGFQAVMKQLPEKVSSYSYTKAEEQARAAYNMLKGGSYQQAIDAAEVAGGGQVDVPDLNKILDPAKLPDFSVFAKYLSDGGGYSILTEDGLMMKQFTLKTVNP